ncbi:reverse transcriptase domain-containing protein [Tanacetum coccineum]
MKLNPKKCLFGIEEGKFLGYVVTSEGIKANPEKTKAVMDMPSPRTLKQMQSLSGKLAALGRFLSKLAERSLPFLDTLKKCTNKKDFRWTETAEAVFLGLKKLVSELQTLTTPKKGETLMMYLAAANKAVSAVFLTKKDGRQMPIHYVSRSLHGAETNYAPMEKLTLALVHAARRLRRVAIKDQVLADSLADTSTEINVALVVASTPRVEDIPESSIARENLTLGPRAWRLYTDGASNSGGSGAGLILIAPDDVEYSYALRLNFSNSNNDAEYGALLAGLRIATEMQVKYIHAFVNYKLVASQVEGSYEAKGERMIKYLEKVLVLAGAFNRERNAMEKIGNYTMMRDARDLIRACDDCQAHASVPRLPKADMILAEKLKIPTLIYYPKRNGAVERENRSLLRGIKTRLEKGGLAWAGEVPNVLWAHQIMKKTSNGETPFSLTYGIEAVIPAKIGLPTHRTSKLNEKTNDQELRLNLDLLEERREIAVIREARYKQQVEKYYNKKVRHVQFKVGEFILRKNKASKDANTGKLGPT